METKPRILYLQKILLERTDEENPLWVFGFNGKVQILAPESVKEQYRQMIAQADEDMQESE